MFRDLMREGNHFRKIKYFLKTRSEDSKILHYLVLVLFFLWLIFDIIKWNWADDPIQKVILAPLGEEPFKMLIAFYFCYIVLLFIYISKITKSNSSQVVTKALVPFGMIAGIIFGLMEGPTNNIISHFSNTAIGSIIIVIIYDYVKNKPWNNWIRVMAIISSLLIPILMHSIHNQYSNIGFASNNSQFEYLVLIGSFLQHNTVLINQTAFTLFEFIVFILFFVFWSIWNLRFKEKN